MNEILYSACIQPAAVQSAVHRDAMHHIAQCNAGLPQSTMQCITKHNAMKPQSTMECNTYYYYYYYLVYLSHITCKCTTTYNAMYHSRQCNVHKPQCTVPLSTMKCTTKHNAMYHNGQALQCPYQGHVQFKKAVVPTRCPIAVFICTTRLPYLCQIE